MKENEQREFNVVNVIATGTQLDGNIVTNGDIRIDGIIKGNVVSKAKVIVGREGRVEGNITCSNIEIEGHINAESLNVSNLIALKATANLVGNIIAGKIAIEPGAEFSGNCKMHSSKPNIAAPQMPQPEKK
ncbi:MAG: polymer-forming cytoskeletal protein [Bacteroidales bacterium]|nr:polymer-forming cytoskeletal protein [Bacteroidales bacterium]